MVDALFALSVIGLVALTLVYFFSLNRLDEIVDAEKPEWLRYEGDPSVFYAGMPRRFDPNVSLRMLAVAFSSKARLLADASASGYVSAIRIALPTCLMFFAFICWYASIHSA